MTGTGQRASDSALPWGTEALWAQLLPLLPGLSVEVVGRIASTNTALLDRARVLAGDQRQPPSPAAPSARFSGVQVRRSTESRAFGRRAVDMQPCLLIAENQTAGRGRMGRPWQAVAGGSLTFSLAVHLHRADWSGLSLAVGVALADALDPSPHLPVGDAAPARRRFRIGIKWPNDLWLHGPSADAVDAAAAQSFAGRKLGGVLIESVASGEGRMAIIGVGLNVLPMPTPEVATTGFACVQEIDPALTVQSALARVALPLVTAIKTFDQLGFAPFAAPFAARDLLFQRPVVTTLRDAQGEPVRGLAQGVLLDGALCVQTAQGAEVIRSGEVSVRPDEATSAAVPDGSVASSEVVVR